MKVYRLLKIVNRIRSSRLKMFGLWCAHVLKRRYYGVFIDPILGCNYRCQMCYFSDPEVRRVKRGRMTDEQLETAAKYLFPQALKLQIGCGAEPTIDMNATLKLVCLGKQYGVPYISMTTNGALLTLESLLQLAESGLDELTISLHGIARDTYERLMGQTAKFDAFLTLLQTIREVKKRYPALQVRVNYTMNADNVDELVQFDSLFADVPIDFLQLRPIRKIGETEYNNFDLTHVAECLETVVKPLAARCHQKGITVLYPEQIHIERFAQRQEMDARSRLMASWAYQNVNPQSESLERPKYLGKQMWQAIWRSNAWCETMESQLNTPLNYDIR